MNFDQANLAVKQAYQICELCNRKARQDGYCSKHYQEFEAAYKKYDADRVYLEEDIDVRDYA